VVSEGRLANVMAWVSKGAERWSYAVPAEAVVLDQRGCMYAPHVFTVMADQPIAIRNSDATMHNVHAVPKRNDEFNRSQSKGAAELVERFRKPEVPIRIKCDVHSWMLTWAGVFDHPFHGVTDREGTLTLRVPPGKYEVSSWHEFEKFSKPAPRTVAVAAGESKEVEFVYGVR
jgi:hypothetical protein